jgi:hypothetical protein
VWLRERQRLQEGSGGEEEDYEKKKTNATQDF